jgi:hypothetical protein
MGLSFTSAAGPSPDHILLSQIRDSPRLEGQVPVFISPRNWVAQLYTPAPGSLFVASYDLQGYGACIRLRLHTGRLYLPWTASAGLGPRYIASGWTQQ